MEEGLKAALFIISIAVFIIWGQIWMLFKICERVDKRMDEDIESCEGCVWHKAHKKKLMFDYCEFYKTGCSSRIYRCKRDKRYQREERV